MGASTHSAAKATTGLRTDSLGCPLGHLETSQELAGAGVRFYRKRMADPRLGQITLPGSDRGYLVGVSMSEGHQRRIFHGSRASSHEFSSDSFYIRDFADDYRADLRGSFDFLLMEIPRAIFERAADERGGRRVRGLECVTGMKDLVLPNLAAALLPALERPAEASGLFIEQLGLAIHTYLLDQYGGATATVPLRSRRLSHQHEARAKEMLISRLDGSMSIAEIAEACQLSRSYFIRAFRETTGHTPHQWLLLQRLEIARRLLTGSGLGLAEIAVHCGFADQSHFTRVFARLEGKPPGAWRRQAGVPAAPAA